MQMKSRMRELSAVLLVLFAITACDSDDDDDGMTTEAEQETVAAFIGEWTTGCVASQLPNFSAFFTYDFQTTATTWQFVQSAFLDESCSIQEDVILGTETFTTTITGTYTEGDEVTTADGLQANLLELTLETFTNTADEPGEEPDVNIGDSFDALVFVNDANVLFLDDGLLGINEAPGTLVLTLPFNQVQ